MRRIVVIGCPGSGKSTLARELSAILSIPATHLDVLYWQPEWMPHPDAGAFERDVRAVVMRESWVIDGGFIGDAEAGRFSRADTVVQFDLPTLLCLWRVHKRLALDWNRTRADMAPGCREKFDPDFVAYILSYRRRVMPVVDELLAERFRGRLVRIRNDADRRTFLEDAARNAAAR